MMLHRVRVFFRNQLSILSGFALIVGCLLLGSQNRVYSLPQTICGNNICEFPSETSVNCSQDCPSPSVCEQLITMIQSSCPTIDRKLIRQIQQECKVVAQDLITTSQKCRDAGDLLKTIELQLVAECPIVPACSSYLLYLSELMEQAKTKADHHCCPTGQDKCGPRRDRGDDDDDDRDTRTCISLQNDNNNCGACGHVCTQGTSCSNGLCTLRK